MLYLRLCRMRANMMWMLTTLRLWWTKIIVYTYLRYYSSRAWLFSLKSLSEGPLMMFSQSNRALLNREKNISFLRLRYRNINITLIIVIWVIIILINLIFINIVKTIIAYTVILLINLILIITYIILNYMIVIGI